MKKFIILIPLFNDWKSVSRLLNEIDLEIKNIKIKKKGMSIPICFPKKING